MEGSSTPADADHASALPDFLVHHALGIGGAELQPNLTAEHIYYRYNLAGGGTDVHEDLGTDDRRSRFDCGKRIALSKRNGTI
jgi:hypothetical protein